MGAGIGVGAGVGVDVSTGDVIGVMISMIVSSISASEISIFGIDVAFTSTRGGVSVGSASLSVRSPRPMYSTVPRMIAGIITFFM